MQAQMQHVLRQVFGYDTFRPLQAEIVANVLAGRDTLAVMPTGGGKSLCYQLPALMLDGLTVVVSPLISLMKDQVDQLRALGVEAALLNSALSDEAYRRNVSRVRSGEAKLLYLAPETLLKANVLNLLEAVDVSCLSIDEAHCISEWGHDFRPEYRQLARVRTRFPETVCIALTATATPRVREDIAASLGFDESEAFVASFNRENLFLEVAPKHDPTAQTIDFLKKFPDQSGIIYCFSRKQVDALAQRLAREGFSVRPYHAGLSERARSENQERFVRDDVQVIVATIAFGMGINKPNVRFVLHHDLPKNIESYYQEIGRAGRDGLPAHCLLLFSPGDTAKVKFFISQMSDEQERRVATLHLNALLGLAETDLCRRVPLLKYFGETPPGEACGACDNCTTEAKPQDDLTIPAQKFLSCVKRTGERFGATHIVDVLRGSESQKVLKFRHHLLPTHGVGKEYSKKQWLHLSRQFVQKGLLEQDLQYGSLKLTPQAYEVMLDRAGVTGHIEPDRAAPAKAKQEAPEHDRDLFELLRQKRKALADEGNVPPYVVFPDKTLIEMAARYPQTEEAFRTLHGVGEAKAKRYAGAFLALIREYCQTHGVETGQAPQRTPPTAQSDARKHVIVGEAFCAGKPIETLAQQHGIKRTTVIDHLRKYALDGHALPAERLLEASGLSANDQATVFRTFERHGTERLGPVHQALDGRFGYDELKLLLLYLWNAGQDASSAG